MEGGGCVEPIQLWKQCGSDVHAEGGGCVENPIPTGMRRVPGKLEKKMDLLQIDISLLPHRRVISVHAVEESLR